MFLCMKTKPCRPVQVIKLSRNQHPPRHLSLYLLSLYHANRHLLPNLLYQPSLPQLFSHHRQNI